MPSKVYSAAVVGVDAFEIEIEVHAGWGPEGRVAVVGLPDTAVKESRDRVLSALSNSALRRPRGRITINLAPATEDHQAGHFSSGQQLHCRHGIVASVPQLGGVVSTFLLDLALDLSWMNAMLSPHFQTSGYSSAYLYNMMGKGGPSVYE